MNDDTPRSGRCAIVGRPNVGKSTLLNTLLRQKLAIINPKPQTTRTSILGVYVSDDPPTQIAFVDTPGLHRPRNALGRALVESAKGSIAEAEVAVLVTEVDESARPEECLTGEEEEILELVRRSKIPVILAINKVDRLRDKKPLLPLIDQCGKRFAFAAIVPISALRADNTAALIKATRPLLAEGLRYDPELLTDKPERFFVAELVREAAIRLTRQEVPYSIAVWLDEYQDQRRLTRIAATIAVGKEAHKGILIGKGGRRLKAIGSAARAEIESLLGRRVFLKLWVKVAQGWTDDPARARQMVGDGIYHVAR